jgi:hypothetical protein
MRVVGIALMVSVLCAACAFQPADGDEAAAGSSSTPETADGVHVVIPGTVKVQAGGGAQTGAPTPCASPGPSCDPQPPSTW